MTSPEAVLRKPAEGPASIARGPWRGVIGDEAGAGTGTRESAHPRRQGGRMGLSRSRQTRGEGRRSRTAPGPIPWCAGACLGSSGVGVETRTRTRGSHRPAQRSPAASVGQAGAPRPVVAWAPHPRAGEVPAEVLTGFPVQIITTRTRGWRWRTTIHYCIAWTGVIRRIPPGIRQRPPRPLRTALPTNCPAQPVAWRAKPRRPGREAGKECRWQWSAARTPAGSGCDSATTRRESEKRVGARPAQWCSHQDQEHEIPDRVARREPQHARRTVVNRPTTPKGCRRGDPPPMALALRHGVTARPAT